MSHLHLSAQLRRFLITGVSATIIDSTVYTIMLYLGMDFSPAKACGFLTAVAFAYNGHRRWTFSTHGSRKRIIYWPVCNHIPDQQPEQYAHAGNTGEGAED